MAEEDLGMTSSPHGGSTAAASRRREVEIEERLIIDEKLRAANQRAMTMFEAKNYWANRARTAEALLRELKEFCGCGWITTELGERIEAALNQPRGLSAVEGASPEDVTKE